MTDGVKRRAYDSSGRRARSAETRERIVAAARELLLDRGYRATSVAAIAARAGVNADTVYALVGSKPALLRELVERAVSGADRPVPAEQRDFVREIRAEPDAGRRIARYAAAVSRTQERLAPLHRVVLEAGPSEPDVAALWREIGERRFANMHLFVADVRAAAGGLRDGLTDEQGAVHVWTLNGSEVYLLLTQERGWSREDVEAWLTATWQRLLLP